MKNIRKLIPKGILPSRKKLSEISKELDAADKAYEERQGKYYRGSGKRKPATEASWKKTIKLVHGENNEKWSN